MLVPMIYVTRRYPEVILYTFWMCKRVGISVYILGEFLKCSLTCCQLHTAKVT